MPAFGAPIRRTRSRLRDALAIAALTTLVATGALLPTNSARADDPPVVEDVTPPTVGAISVTPDSLELADGPGAVTVTVALTDDSGVEAPSVDTTGAATSTILDSGVLTLISGTEFGGIWSRTIPVPAETAVDEWGLQLHGISDLLGNADPQSYTAGSFSTTFTAPVIRPSAPDAPSATAGDGTAVVSWSARTDAGSHPITAYVVTQSPGGQTVETSSTSATFAGLANGTAYIFTVAARSDAGLSDASAPSAAVTPLVATALSTTVPSIAGAAVVGTALTANPGTWVAGTTLTYRWFADGAVIPGAVARTFVATTAQQGKAITVEVSGAKTGYSSLARISPATTRVLLSAAPTITGSPAVGVALSAVPGAWTSGTAFTYQWRANGTAIPGATKATFTPTAAQKDAVITVTVTGTKSGHASTSKTSAGTVRVLVVATPTVSGSAVVGSVVTASPGSWTAGSTLTYQWFADGVAIAGATKSTHTLAAAQRDKALTVRVTGSKAGYGTATRPSAATPRVQVAPTPTLGGVLASGFTLTAAAGTWSSGTALSYQWFAAGKAIAGATKSTLALTTAQHNAAITVRVTGTKAGYPTVARTSAASAKVTLSAAPKVSGTALSGSTLTAVTGTWLSGTTLRYQWFAGGVAIAGATKSTLAIGSGQVGKAVTVTVTGSKAGYGTVARTSSATLKVPLVATPRITGSATTASTLTAVPGTWSAGTTFTYQWFANGAAIAGATKATLVVSEQLNGKRLTVATTGRASGFTTVTRTSAASAVVMYPGRTAPVDVRNCPAWAPIKGNINTQRKTMIFHVKGSRYYDRTTPTECFRTEKDAIAAGYRKPLN